MVLVTVKEWMSDGVSASNQHLQIIAGTIYLHEQMFEEAMKVLHQANSLEAYACSDSTSHSSILIIHDTPPLRSITHPSVGMGRRAPRYTMGT